MSTKKYFQLKQEFIQDVLESLNPIIEKDDNFKDEKTKKALIQKLLEILLEIEEEYSNNPPVIHIRKKNVKKIAKQRAMAFTAKLGKKLNDTEIPLEQKLKDKILEIAANSRVILRRTKHPLYADKDTIFNSNRIIRSGEYIIRFSTAYVAESEHEPQIMQDETIYNSMKNPNKKISITKPNIEIFTLEESASKSDIFLEVDSLSSDDESTYSDVTESSISSKRSSKELSPILIGEDDELIELSATNPREREQIPTLMDDDEEDSLKQTASSLREDEKAPKLIDEDEEDSLKETTSSSRENEKAPTLMDDDEEDSLKETISSSRENEKAPTLMDDDEEDSLKQTESSSREDEKAPTLIDEDEEDSLKQTESSSREDEKAPSLIEGKNSENKPNPTTLTPVINSSTQTLVEDALEENKNSQKGVAWYLSVLAIILCVSTSIVLLGLALGSIIPFIAPIISAAISLPIIAISLWGICSKDVKVENKNANNPIISNSSDIIPEIGDEITKAENFRREATVKDISK